MRHGLNLKNATTRLFAFVCALLCLGASEARANEGYLCDVVARGAIRLESHRVEPSEYLALGTKLEQLADYLESQTRLIPGTPTTEGEILQKRINKKVVAGSRLDEKYLRTLAAELKRQVDLEPGERIEVHVLPLPDAGRILLDQGQTDLELHRERPPLENDLSSYSAFYGAAVLSIVLRNPNLPDLFQYVSAQAFARDWTHHFVAHMDDKPAGSPTFSLDGRRDPSFVSYAFLPDLSDPMNYSKAQLVLVRKFKNSE